MQTMLKAIVKHLNFSYFSLQREGTAFLKLFQYWYLNPLSNNTSSKSVKWSQNKKNPQTVNISWGPFDYTGYNLLFLCSQYVLITCQKSPRLVFLLLGSKAGVARMLILNTESSTQKLKCVMKHKRRLVSNIIRNSNQNLMLSIYRDSHTRPILMAFSLQACLLRISCPLLRKKWECPLMYLFCLLCLYLDAVFSTN